MASKWPRCILFGDSLTQHAFEYDGGWGSMLADLLIRKCDVIPRGFTGYNTRWNKAILPTIVDKDNSSDIAFMTIFLGVNDACKPDLGEKQHIPLDQYKKNTADMVSYLESVGVSKDKLILISTPPCDEEAWEKYCQDTGRAEYIAKSKDNKMQREYAEACGVTAQECGVDFINLYKAMIEQKDWPAYLSDGLHLSRKGSELLFEKLQPLVEKRTSHLPMIYPEWKAIDHVNPEKSLFGNEPAVQS